MAHLTEMVASHTETIYPSLNKLHKTMANNPLGTADQVP